MKTCVSLIKAVTANKNLCTAHETITWCQEYVMHLSPSDIPHLSQYKIENWSTDSVNFSFLSAELLDHHQEVLDIPSERKTLPQRSQ